MDRFDMKNPHHPANSEGCRISDIFLFLPKSFIFKAGGHETKQMYLLILIPKNLVDLICIVNTETF